jgi:N-acetylglucosaminyl-diphospho-decaprenol L-rhamnosyltransferase
MYAEDVDLCWKAKKRGRKVYHVPEAVVVHHGGQSSDSRAEPDYAAIMIRESLFRFLRIYRGSGYAWMFRAATVLCAGARMALLSAVLPSRRAGVRRAWAKWARILGWSLGFQQWAHREVLGSAVSAASAAGER